MKSHFAGYLRTKYDTYWEKNEFKFLDWSL